MRRSGTEPHQGRAAPSPSPAGIKERISLALDVLRGIAAIFMVVNHVGAQLVGRAVLGTPLGAFVFFASSAAPVLFFFATGFAGALRPPGGGWLGRLRTVLCLEVADVLFAFGRHAVWYLDFFGFIALSALVVDALAGTRHAARWAAVAAALLLLLRYAVAPMLVDVAGQQPLLAWALGFPATRHASYPLTPWLCFPLAGFALGRWCLQRSAAVAAWRLPGAVLAATTVLAVAAATWAHDTGHSMNRWGEVTGGYLVASVGIVGIAGGLALVATALPAAARRALSLRGVAAYAVVPLHYGFIAALLAAGIGLGPEVPYLACAAVLAGLALVLARRYADGLRVLGRRRSLRPVAAIVVLACAAAEWRVTAPGPAATALVLVAQLALAAWLLPAPKPGDLARAAVRAA